MHQNHPINPHIHFFLGSRACAGACKGGGGERSLPWCLGADPHPEPTPLYPGSGGRNRPTPVELALVGGPGTRTSWCEQAPVPSLLGPPVTAPPRPKSGRARTRPHPVRTGPASVRVRGPGLPPVGPERPSECAADRGGGGPGPPPGMPQITRSMPTYIFFSGQGRVQGPASGGGGEGSLPWCLGADPHSEPTTLYPGSGGPQLFISLWWGEPGLAPAGASRH